MHLQQSYSSSNHLFKGIIWQIDPLKNLHLVFPCSQNSLSFESGSYKFFFTVKNCWKKNRVIAIRTVSANISNKDNLFGQYDPNTVLFRVLFCCCCFNKCVLLTAKSEHERSGSPSPPHPYSLVWVWGNKCVDGRMDGAWRAHKWSLGRFNQSSKISHVLALGTFLWSWMGITRIKRTGRGWACPLGPCFAGGVRLFAKYHRC